MEENGDAAIAGVLAIVTVLMLMWVVAVEIRDSRRGGAQPKRYVPPPATPKPVRNSGVGNPRVNIKPVTPKDTGAMSKYLKENTMYLKHLKALNLNDVGKRVRYETHDGSTYEGTLHTIEIEWARLVDYRLSGEKDVNWRPEKVVLRIGAAEVSLSLFTNPPIKFLDD